MPKKTIIILIIVVVLLIGLVGGYFYWKESRTPEGAGTPAEKLTEGATKGVLPSLGANPLESKPNLNPADKANPFKNIKTNPFE